MNQWVLWMVFVYTVFNERCSVLLGRLLRVNLTTWVEKCPSVRLSVRPSVHKKWFDFNGIWYVGRGWRVMHDGIQYDPIQGQGQGHETLKVWNSAIFNGYLPPPNYDGAGKWLQIITLSTIPKAYRDWIFEFCPSFCVTWLWSSQ